MTNNIDVDAGYLNAEISAMCSSPDIADAVKAYDEMCASFQEQFNQHDTEANKLSEELNRLAEYVFEFKDEQRANSISFPSVRPTMELNQLQE